LRVEVLDERAPIERFLRRAAPAQIYGLADLDDAFWGDTRWYGSRGSDGALAAVCLVLEKLALPIVYAVAPPGDAATLELVRALRPRLPRVFFANLPVGYEHVLGESHEIAPLGEYVKLWLPDASGLESFEVAGIERLGSADAVELERFYAERAFGPGEHLGFYARYMLELAPWFGVRERGELVCVAGVHVCSERYGVAALGNVATAPARRGHGLARAVCARLARELSARVPLLGLNVATANAPARRCYRALGFREALRYEEAVLTRRADSL
jgi:ribosomal protein S18 acetylase RimI-like enzyme